MITPFSDIDERALKTLTGELVSAVGGTGAAAKILWKPDPKDGNRPKDFSEARISGYCTIADMERSMPIRQVTRLEVAAQLPLVSRWMAERIVRDGSAPRGLACAQDLCRIVRETSDLNGVLSDAVTDGYVNTAAEKAAVRAAIVDLRRELDALEAKVV